MADFNSKYTGQQVEALLDIVKQGGSGGGGGGTITEAELLAMGFTKNLGTITEVKMNGASKGTSGVVDLGTVITEHQDISGKQDKVEGKGLSTEDFTSALKSKLEGLSNYDDTEIANAVSSLQTQINTLVSGNPSDAINSFNEIIAFLAGVKDSEDLDNIIASIERQIAEKQDPISDLATIRTNASKGATAVQPSSLAPVATSGDYSDLNNKPTIPSEVTEATVSGWGFTKNSGTYSKPSTGIPVSDLTIEVQTSLDKADTALQSYTEKYQGTVEAVDINEEVDEPDTPQITENAVSTNRIIACVARFDGTQWNLINDEGHTPLNVTGISGTTEDEFTITFPAYSKVNSLVATPDETLAAGGIKCGASVGLDYATIRLRQDRLVRLYVATNDNGNGGTVTRQEWDTRTDVSGFTVSIIQNTSLGDYIRLDDTKGNIDGSALPTVGGAFNTFLFGTKPGYINIQLRTADGNVSDYKNAEFQIGWPMLNVKPIFTSQEISKGNVWIYGIMEE